LLEHRNSALRRTEVVAEFQAPGPGVPLLGRGPRIRGGHAALAALPAHLPSHAGDGVLAAARRERACNSSTSAVKRAKLSALHFHDLRHTFASWVAPEHLRTAATALDGLLGPGRKQDTRDPARRSGVPRRLVTLRKTGGPSRDRTEDPVIKSQFQACRS
jgi:hypothetical protein